MSEVNADSWIGDLLTENNELTERAQKAEAVVGRLSKYYQEWVYFGDGDDRLAEFVKDLMDELGVETETQ